MKKAPQVISASQEREASLGSAIIYLLTAKMPDEARINRIIEKIKIRYSHLSPAEYEKALEPLLCLDPASLYKLLRDCNDEKDGLSAESGLNHFKLTIHLLLTKVIAEEASPDILEPCQAKEYNSLAFSKLAGAKRKLTLDASTLKSLEEGFSKNNTPSSSKDQKKVLLPSHLNRSIEASTAYLMAAIAHSRSNSEFRSMIGIDIIKASYTTLKLSKNHPDLQEFDSAKPKKLLPSKSRIVCRIFDELITRYVRGLRMSEVSLYELGEYVSQLTRLQAAESRTSSLKISIASLMSDLSIAESEKDKLLEKIVLINNHHREEIDNLKSMMLSTERGNSVVNAETGQKIRSILIESRRRLESEVTKLELLLQGSSTDTASSRQRLIDRIRSTIAELEAKIQEVVL
jgi:hypothetical protein